MNTRLPFTLLPDEPFGLWWHAYAVRLGITRTELAHAMGIPAGTPPGPEHTASIASATGLTTCEIANMFTLSRPCPPEHVLRVWTPQPFSRFCPRCLADGAAWQHAWALPLTFHCLAHNTPLVERCPACDQAPPSRRTPADATLNPSSCPSCGHDLSTGRQRGGRGEESTAAAQKRDPP